ncbi:catalase [Streptomyces sp. NPDC054786]
MTVQETGPLTTESGALVADNRNSEQAGPGGPVPAQDQGLLEELARFHRGRIVHARGVGAWAVITSTSRGRLRGARSCTPYLPSSHICRA